MAARGNCQSRRTSSRRSKRSSSFRRGYYSLPNDIQSKCIRKPSRTPPKAITAKPTHRIDLSPARYVQPHWAKAPSHQTRRAGESTTYPLHHL
ncbi:hypothetical protein EMPG_14546 [Blastomyces silverae]|uniref:Uncharacterized protein n=1 Tax=Blastomyces silverae TaxID=2060906 RepID=A0A0H1BLK2_9EURO|nr:hypothetical protein EMPG_14546 [Blastomyces silverae]